jgi:serine/threonine-protein kinase
MDRWHQVEKLYHQASACAERDRAAFLDDACAGDLELRKEVESLLAQETTDDSSFMRAGAMEEMAKELAHDDLGLAQGTQLGSYTVLSPVGKGGMGEVYRARDTKLGRDVAIKVLPPTFALDPDRVARFNREARLLAALNHPNIATIHSIEESDGRKFLVLELVEGETLANRLKRGPSALSETLQIAVQIAEALEAAHEKGVIHRDLKPANIQITPEGRVKVLDFGLAKVLSEGPDGQSSQSPTVTAQAMEKGVLLGTAAYMSPEQARGASVDRRTDIWAFGCVLYEMLTGSTLFREKTVTETLAKVLEGHIDLDALPPQTPPSVIRLVQRCLQRDPRERLQHIGDARVEIRDILAGSVAHSTEMPAVAAKQWRSLAWVGVFVVLAALSGWFFARRTVPNSNPVTTRSFIGPIPAPAAEPFGKRSIALSLDGTRLAYVSRTQLFVRPMNRTEAAPVSPKALKGSPAPNSLNPFFSPDSKWVGFAQFYDLVKVSVNGGAPVPIASFKGRNMGGTWSPDGTIVFSNGTGLYSVSDEGGEPKLLIAPEREGLLYVWPEFMPGGRSLLFTRLPAGSVEAAEILLLDLRSMKSTVVLRGGTGARYVPAGYLVYATGRGLEAIGFDPNTGKVRGDSVVIPGAEVTLSGDNGAADFAVSGNGTLVHMPPTNRTVNQLVWVDSKGREQVIGTVAPGPFGYPRLSPDGKRVALDIVGPNRDIYVVDLERGSRVRLSEGPNEDMMPVWSSDGRRVYYGSNRDGFQVYSRAADGTGSEERLSSDPDVQMAFRLAPGNRLLFFKGPYERSDIGRVGLAESGHIEWVLNGKYREANPDVSPDGNWIAYESNESGQNEIWVRPYPNVDQGRYLIGSGLHPRWDSRGTELFYRSPDWAMMAVSVHLSAEFRAETPRQLFPDNRYFRGGGVGYDVAPDRRFLMTQAVGEAGAEQIMIGIVLNWIEELKTLLR